MRLQKWFHPILSLPTIGHSQVSQWIRRWWWPITLCGLKVHSKDILCRLRKYECLRYSLFISSIQSRNDFSSRRFFHKTNERIRLYYYDISGRLVFVRFFGRNWRHQKDISKLTDLEVKRKKSVQPITSQFWFFRCPVIWRNFRFRCMLHRMLICLWYKLS